MGHPRVRERSAGLGPASFQVTSGRFFSVIRVASGCNRLGNPADTTLVQLPSGRRPCRLRRNTLPGLFSGIATEAGAPGGRPVRSSLGRTIANPEGAELSDTPPTEALQYHRREGSKFRRARDSAEAQCLRRDMYGVTRIFPDALFGNTSSDAMLPPSVTFSTE